MAFDPVPAASLMAPVAGNPFSVGARWRDPVAGHPDIAGAVPAVITANPDPTRMRTPARMFDDDRRRADANVDVLRRC